MSRESIYKQIVKNTGIYSIAVTAGKMTSFILLPVYTRYLTPTDYGIIELLELTSFIFSALIGMRIGDALFYYYAQAANQQKREQVICTVFLGSSLLGITGGVIGWVAAPALSRAVLGGHQYTDCFRLVFTTFAFSLPLETGFCYMRAVNRPVAYVTASLLRLLLAIPLNIILLLSGLGIYAVLWSSLAVTAFMATYMGVFSLWGIPLRSRFSRSLLATFLRYSAPLALSGLSMFIIHYGDRFFLQKYVSLADIGIYSLAYKLGMLISYIQTPFDVYWRSQMFSIVRGPEGEKIYVRVGTYLTLSLTFIVLLFALFAEPALRLMTPSSFWPAAQYVPWIAAAYVIRTVGAHFRCVFLLKGKTGREFHVTAAGGLTCLAGYAALIPPFGLWGAVAGTLAGFGVMFIIGLHQAQKVHWFPFEYNRLAIATIAGFSIGALFTFARPDSIWLHAALAIVFASMYPALLLIVRFPHRDERHAARHFVYLLTTRATLWRARARAHNL